MHNKLSDTQIHKLKKYFYRINKSWEQQDKNNISKYCNHFKYHLGGEGKEGKEGKEGDGKGESPPAPKITSKIEQLSKIIETIFLAISRGGGRGGAIANNNTDINAKIDELTGIINKFNSTDLNKKVKDFQTKLESEKEAAITAKDKVIAEKVAAKEAEKNAAIEAKEAEKNAAIEAKEAEKNEAIAAKEEEKQNEINQINGRLDNAINNFQVFQKTFNELLELLGEPPSPTSST